MWRNQPVILAIDGPLCISLTVGRVTAECNLFKQKSLCIPDLYGMSYGLDRAVRARNFQPELKIVVSQAARKRAVRCLDPLQARSLARLSSEVVAEIPCRGSVPCSRRLWRKVIAKHFRLIFAIDCVVTY